MLLQDDFTSGIADHWHVGEIGNGVVAHAQRDSALALVTGRSDNQNYHDAQISDYIPAQRNFRLKPPIQLTVKAHSPSDMLKGTAGFGFWNHPFVPTERGFRLPQAIWFFYSCDESNMALAKGVQGHGWKAATFNAQRGLFYSLLPTALVAMPLMRVPAAYDALWDVGQRAIGVSETALDVSLLQEIHTYVIEWTPEQANFYVDDECVLSANVGIPTNPLGFIAWVDNQYAIVTPQGQFKFGYVAMPYAQSLLLHDVRIARI